MKMEGKIALVAGASRGIGLAIARRLSGEGVQLVLPWHDDRPDDSRAMCEEFCGGENKHIAVRTDLRKIEDVKNLARTIKQKCGHLHILINNIERGGMPVIHGSYEHLVNKDQWLLEMETTLLAKRLLFEQSLPLLRKADNASVINISSIAGLTGRSGPTGHIFSDGYAAANRGIASLTETWARLAAPRIRVNEIMLGLIDTRHGRDTRGWGELSDTIRKQLTDHILLKRTGSPEEVAETVLFLVRDASYMTGSTIRLDGGYMLGSDSVPEMPEGIL